jgi:transcriptional regulator with XRE-family HTH domain
MQFELWVQERRAERGLDVRTFAAQTGVDVGTISRIENARTQVTLNTAVQICEGIGASLTDLLEALLGKHFPTLEQQPPSEEKVMPTIRDAEAFLAYAHRDQHACYSWLAHLLNSVDTLDGISIRNKRKRVEGLFVSEDIHKLLHNPPFYRFELQYPGELRAETIWNIYREGGLLTYTDIGASIKHIRREKQVTLARLEGSVKISASVLSNLESGSIERIRLIDVLTLDQQLAQEGKIIAMYWSVGRFHQKLVCQQQQDGDTRRGEAVSQDEIEQDAKLITMFTTICRWLQVVNGDTTSWIEELRTQLRQLNPQC